VAIIDYSGRKIRIENLYSLARVSSPGQKTEGLERQMHRSRTFAAEHGIPIDDELVATASGSKGHHIRKGRKLGPLGEFIRRAETRTLKPYPGLAVESFSRLSRQKGLDHLDLFTRIIRSAVTLVTLTSNRYYTAELINDEAGAMHMVWAEIQAARVVAEDKSDYSRYGYTKRRGKQTAVRVAWLGARRLADGEDNRRRYEHYILPGAEEILLRIFKEAENFSVDRIAARLNAEKVPVFERWNRQ
jgi:hypothetical protein